MPKYEYAPLECTDRKNMFSFESAFTYNEKPPEYVATEKVKQSCCTSMIHWLATIICFILTIILFPVVGCFAIKIVRDYERLVIFRLGMMQRQRSAGVTLVLPCIDVCHRVDMRMRAFSVPPRQIRLRNDAIVELGCEVHFRIDNAVRCILNVSDLNGSLRVLAQTTMVNRISKLRFDELEFGRVDCAKDLVADLNGTTRTWGVSIQRCEISQLKVINAPSTLTFSNNNGQAQPTAASASQPTAPFNLPPMAGGNGVPGMPFLPMMAGNNSNGTNNHAEIISQLVQHFLPTLSQLFGNVNQMVTKPVSAAESASTLTTKLSDASSITSAKSNESVLIDVGSMHQAAMAMNASSATPALPVSTIQSSNLAAKIEALIQVAQRTLLEDATLRAHLNALYLFKIFPGTQLGGTPNACYILDAKTQAAAASADSSLNVGQSSGASNGSAKVDEQQTPKSPNDFRIQIDCSLSIGEADLEALFEGRLNTWQAFLQGRVQVDGDMNAALRLTELLDKMKTKFF